MERDKREFIVTILGLVLFISAITYFSDEINQDRVYVGDASPTAHVVDVPLRDAPVARPRRALALGGRFGQPPAGNGTNITINHTECRHRACVTVTGPGRNQCHTNRDCRHPVDERDRRVNRTNITEPPGNETNVTIGTHLSCQGLACMITPGSGTNQCINNSDCLPTNASWLVFVTHTKVNSTIGGGNITFGLTFGVSPLRRGKSLCANEAIARGYATHVNQFKPWLSTQPADTSPWLISYPPINAKDIISPGSFKNIYGQTIANSRADLLDGTLLNPIDNSRGRTLTDYVWTGTKSDGTVASNNCQDWTSGSSSNTAVTGFPHTSVQTWTQGLPTNCDQRQPIYCFQVS